MRSNDSPSLRRSAASRALFLLAFVLFFVAMSKTIKKPLTDIRLGTCDSPQPLGFHRIRDDSRARGDQEAALREDRFHMIHWLVPDLFWRCSLSRTHSVGRAEILSWLV